MKYLLSVLVISIATLLTGCKSSDGDPLPTPPPQKKVLEETSGGYVDIDNLSTHRSLDLSIYNSPYGKSGAFTLKDLYGKTRFFTLSSIDSEDSEIEFIENISRAPSSYMHLEFFENGDELKLTIKELDTSLGDLGLNEGQSIQLKRISQHKDFSILEKLAFYSKDNKYDLEIIKNKDGTAKIQGNQTELGCKIEATLNKTDEGEDVGSFRVSSKKDKFRKFYSRNDLKFSGCSDQSNDGIYIVAMYTYERNSSQRIKLLISKLYTKGATSVELTAN